MDIQLSVYFSADRHMNCFQVGAIMNEIAMSVLIPAVRCACVLISLGYISSLKLLCCKEVYILATAF